MATIPEFTENKLNLKFGFFREAWPERERGFLQVRNGIDEVHAVVTEFVGINNRNNESGDLTDQGVARRNAPAAGRLLGRLRTALDRAEREAEIAFRVMDQEAETASGLKLAGDSDFGSEIRSRLAALGGQRAATTALARARAKDTETMRAIAAAPAWLSGLTEDQKARALDQFRVAGDPGLLEKRKQLNLALEQLRKGVKAAEALIRTNSEFDAGETVVNLADRSTEPERRADVA